MLQLTAGPTPTMATKNMQPYVEDCLSDDGQDGQGVSITEAFSPELSPGKANVRTKRSNPGEMGSDGTQKGPTNIDVKSDSGYSSQSVTGLSSADSAASAASSSRGPSARPAAPSPTPPSKPSRRPSTTRRESTQSSQSASRHAPSRRDSQTSRRPTAERRPTLTTPQPPVSKERRDSLRDAESRPRLHSRRQSMLNAQPAESAPDLSYQHGHDTRSQVSDPAQYPGSSPRESRPPRYHTPQGGPVIQPAISRRLSVNSRQPRPTSYHGESPYPYMPHPHAPQEHGPPPSRSAYGNMHFGQPHMAQPYMPQFPQQGYAPAAYLQAQQMQPMREQQRPQLLARTQTLNSAYPHPQSPVMHVERNGRNMPSTRYHINPPPLAQRQPTRIAYNQEQDDSESDSESGYSEEELDHRQRFQPGAHQRRPSLRHASTTPAPQVPEIRRPQTIVVPGPRDARGHDRTPAPRAQRRTSMSRPPLVPHKAQTEYPTSQTRTIVENSRSSRRQPQVYDRSVHDHRRSHQQEYNDLQRSERSSQVYDSRITGRDFELEYQDEEEEAERKPLRRRGTDADSRRRSHRPVELRQAADAEDYINASRGDRDTLADQSYEVAKTRSKRASVGPSEAESSRSRGSDTNGEIRLRIGNDAPVTLSLNGDMEGRVLSLVPVENGMNELVISSNNRGESHYRSERGSTWGDRERRAIMPASQPRRDAEELTERSLRSNRTRRGEQDEQRRTHRPRRERRSEYHDR